ncbi:DNA-protecting protein DprA [Mobilitalea sibirica]|uniref:DNA-protecting protein DprA n=1 Tax=Mobilitalea sibirica TaxID=1462919 RepID=A0A8J7HDF0_9FIRM|nr:DNA-processing protein DprA [Mobilitalea sibirica]MBH1941977.1 DNA-protecting protein DprA [Mobilitalea sibirica]
MKFEEYNYWLANLDKIGPVKIEKLIHYFEKAEHIFHASKNELMAYIMNGYDNRGKLTETDIDNLMNSRDKEKIKKNYDKLKNQGIYFVSKEDSRYPINLKNIYGAPFALYIKGKLPEEQKKKIAVIGARECSAYGKEMAKYLAGALAGEGIEIISGLARGIDSYAHEGALTACGVTYGVLGCGIDICYPKENINLYMEMQKDGGIISEYAPGTRPLAGHFPMRNRIISGLSDAVLVIEAKEKSGSLITVDMGLEQGKEIYALPGRATDRLSEGCNNLIKMGAKLVTTPKDILEDFIPNYGQKVVESKKNNKLLETKGKIVYACLSLEPKHIEEIALETNLPLDALMEQLVLLELQGFVRQAMKNYYVTRE